MNQTIKPTNGPWAVSIRNQPFGDKREILYHIHAPTEILDSILIQKVHQDNAQLIHEAGTVYHETGLTPRELKEQRDQLLSYTRIMKSWVAEDLISAKAENNKHGDMENLKVMHEKLEAAIAAASEKKGEKP